MAARRSRWPVVGLSCSGVNDLAVPIFEGGVAVDRLLLLGVSAFLGPLDIGIAGQAGSRGTALACGGGRSRLGGTTSGERSR